ncbi:hypothetical protein ACFX2J_002597 [Malus domestica]
MEKSKSFPHYTSAYSGEFDFRERSNSYNFNGPTQKGSGFATSTDPELQRKKRVASYNVFTMEGKVKTSLRNSFKWIKNSWFRLSWLWKSPAKIEDEKKNEKKKVVSLSARLQ